MDVRVDGAPLDRILLPAGEDLTIGDLLAGRWSLEVRWNAQTIYEELLTVERDPGGRNEEPTWRRIVVPRECIEGQDEEAWQRAGREYPLGVN